MEYPCTEEKTHKPRFQNICTYIPCGIAAVSIGVLIIPTALMVALIYLMDNVYKLLLDQKARQERNKALLGKAYVESDYICTWDDGRLITPDYVTRAFHKVVTENGLPPVRLHDLRHSVASNLLNAGFSPTDVAAWLGHSSPTTTFGYYAYASKAFKGNISNALEGWFETKMLENG